MAKNETIESGCCAAFKSDRPFGRSVGLHIRPSITTLRSDWNLLNLSNRPSEMHRRQTPDTHSVCHSDVMRILALIARFQIFSRRPIKIEPSAKLLFVEQVKHLCRAIVNSVHTQRCGSKVCAWFLQKWLNWQAPPSTSVADGQNAQIVSSWPNATASRMNVEHCFGD